MGLVICHMSLFVLLCRHLRRLFLYVVVCLCLFYYIFATPNETHRHKQQKESIFRVGGVSFVFHMSLCNLRRYVVICRCVVVGVWGFVSCFVCVVPIT